MPRTLYLAAALAMAALGPVHAQTGEWTPPHPMLLTPERALAMLTAFDRQLDYVPGEVLVQFRPGVSASGTARAAVAPQQTAGVRSAVDR